MTIRRYFVWGFMIADPVAVAMNATLNSTRRNLGGGGGGDDAGGKVKGAAQWWLLGVMTTTFFLVQLAVRPRRPLQTHTHHTPTRPHARLTYSCVYPHRLAVACPTRPSSEDALGLPRRCPQHTKTCFAKQHTKTCFFSRRCYW